MSLCIFVPSHSKSHFSPSKKAVLRIVAIPKSVETPDTRGGVGKVGNFGGIERAVGWRCFWCLIPFSAHEILSLVDQAT